MKARTCVVELFAKILTWQAVNYRAPTGNLLKNMGNMGTFLSRIWEVYGIFQQKYGRNMGKIRVHQTEGNIEDKSESKFMHLNITMF